MPIPRAWFLDATALGRGPQSRKTGSGFPHADDILGSPPGRSDRALKNARKRLAPPIAPKDEPGLQAIGGIRKGAPSSSVGLGRSNNSRKPGDGLKTAPVGGERGIPAPGVLRRKTPGYGIPGGPPRARPTAVPENGIVLPQTFRPNAQIRTGWDPPGLAKKRIGFGIAPLSSFIWMRKRRARAGRDQLREIPCFFKRLYRRDLPRSAISPIRATSPLVSAASRRR